MEFGDDDDHEEEEQEDEGDQEDEDDDDDEDDEGITIPPPPSTQQPTQTQVEASPSNHNQEQLSFRKPGLTSSSSISTPASSTTNTYRYRECLKNHAVSMGGHAVDGCGEFMPAGEEGTLESFKCAACGCHRNFHRKESDISSTPPPPPPPPLYPHHQFSSSPFNYRTPLPPQPSPFQVVAPPPPSQTVHHHNYRPGRLALPSSGRIDHYQLHNREMDEFSNPSSSGGGGGGGTRRVTSGSGSGSGKSKRFRTKFTPEQKERMLEFAERVGWRLQKHDEIAVQQFCQDVGVRRQVLKVWMHNNKNTLGGSSSRRSTTV